MSKKPFSVGATIGRPNKKLRIRRKMQEITTVFIAGRAMHAPTISHDTGYCEIKTRYTKSAKNTHPKGNGSNF